MGGTWSREALVSYIVLNRGCACILTLTSLPSTDRGQKAVTEVVLTVDISLHIFPLELILPTTSTANAIPLIAHCFSYQQQQQYHLPCVFFPSVGQCCVCYTLLANTSRRQLSTALTQQTPTKPILVVHSRVARRCAVCSQQCSAAHVRLWSSAICNIVASGRRGRKGATPSGGRKRATASN